MAANRHLARHCTLPDVIQINYDKASFNYNYQKEIEEMEVPQRNNDDEEEEEYTVS